jgi:hypothetical protein
VTRIAICAIAALTLTACRATAPDGYVSLKDVQPQIKRPATSKVRASPIILAPVIVVAPTKETAADLEQQMMIELASLGYRVSDTGTWRIMGVATGTSVQWTLIDKHGFHVGTVSQSNPNGGVAASTEVVASSAAKQIAKLLP